MTSSLMTDHNMFGWYIYAPFMLLLFKLGGYLSDKERKNTQEAFSNNTTAQNTKNKLNHKSILFVLIVLMLSSTTLKQYLSPNIEQNNQPVTLLLDPKIYNYSSLDVMTSNKTETHLVYNFNGNKLEGKPTFFDNNLIPKGWEAISTELTSEQQTITLKKYNQKALLTISYEINGKHSATIGQFKKARLKSALIGQGKTSLHWHFKLFE